MLFLTGAEGDDPDIEEVAVGDAGVGLVDLVQPAAGTPLHALRRRKQRCRCRSLVSIGGGHCISLLLLIKETS